MPGVRRSVNSKNQLRSLKQYKDMPDEDFEELFKQREYTIKKEDFEDRIKEKLDEFAIDYDIDDLKSNDRLVLRQMIQAMIALEDYEIMQYELRLSGVSDSNILLMDKISSAMSNLRRDISKMQDDLKITRRIRKNDNAESVLGFIEDLKLKAKKFLEERMFMVTCPECHLLLFQGWFLFPSEKNKMTFICGRDMGDGTKCNHTFTVTSKELLENRGFNNKDIIPESLR